MNCGVRHVQGEMTLEISLDRDGYARAPRTVGYRQFRTGSDEYAVTPELHKLYLSLLGAVPDLSRARVGLVVFIVPLRRRNHDPDVQRVRTLNELLRWLRRKPRMLTYRRMPHVRWGRSQPRVISVAAFKKEAGNGYCHRGALFVPAP